MIANRRIFAIVALAWLALLPDMAWAQAAPKVRRIAFLHPGSMAANGDLQDTLRKALNELGYVDGKDISIEMHWAEGRMDELPRLAAEIVRSKPDVILATGGRAPGAVQAATKTIPIVGVSATDPATNSNVASMRRPGGNFTGTTNQFAEVVPKWIELARELVPRASRVGVLTSTNPTHAARLETALVAARRLQLELVPVQAKDPTELESAFATMATRSLDVVVVLSDSMFSYNRAAIITLAARYKLPAIYAQRQFVDDGGLLSYGPSFAGVYQRVAGYVDKIFRGARPGDLPIEQPTRIELTINARTAKTLGMTLSQSLLLRADEVVQ